ncbi:MAG: DNA repair protein RecN [Ideonella sp.]|nr:DNA repair protein RecN [Ideonella sp.]
MLKRLALRNFVIVPELEVEFDAGFSVLTGETGAGKSILIDALQLALGSRGDVGLLREGSARAEVSAEFEAIPPALRPWLEAAGFDAADTLLLRRTLDAQGKSRAWINGSPATIAQLREAAEQLVEIHGQHAWQRLTRPGDARALLDAQAGADSRAVAALFGRWKDAQAALQRARERRDEIERERERLAWQADEIGRLAPQAGEWEALNAEHDRLSHAQALTDAARQALDGLSQRDGSAGESTDRALAALQAVARFDAATLEPIIEVLRGAQAQLADAAHSLHGYLGRDRDDAQRLAQLDARLAAWHGLARRLRRPPDELPALLAQWRAELDALDAGGDVSALVAAIDTAERDYRGAAQRLSAARRQAAAALATAVTQAMQGLGMAGGRFEVALPAQESPQSFGLESVEFQVAGHAGATPRALAKVASGGELSRLALAIAVTTSRAQHDAPRSAGHDAGGNDARDADPAGSRTADPARGRDGSATLIFDEIDAGIGGTVGDMVGALMKQLGRSAQVLAVTHLAQVAACGDQHWLVRKQMVAQRAQSDLQRVAGEARVAEIARMLGGERASGTAHAQALLHGAAALTAAPIAPVASRRPRAPRPSAAGDTPARARRSVRS